jgi:hypothetical protein
MHTSWREITATSASRSGGMSNRRHTVALSSASSMPSMPAMWSMICRSLTRPRDHTRTKPPSDPWCATKASVMGQMTMVSSLPNFASRMSCSQITLGSPAALLLSLMPWSAVSASVMSLAARRPNTSSSFL